MPGDKPRVLQVGSDDGWQEWTEVTHFADSKPDSQHFMLDAISGEVVFGPAVRQADGTMRQYGAVPSKGAVLRMQSYRTGGGRRGNVARNSLRILRSSIPFIARVENRHPARGGVDAEDIEDAKERGPILLRTGNRAVTIEDYEILAREAAPEVARVRAVAAGDGADAGSVRVLIVPSAAPDGGRLRFEQLIPSDDAVERIASYLDERRMIGARVVVEPPSYQGVTITARLRARPRTDPTRLQAAALEALYSYFNPVNGGPDGRGWDVRAPGPRGRGLLRPPGSPRHRARRGGEAVRGRPDERPARQGSRADRARQARARVLYEHRVRVEV